MSVRRVGDLAIGDRLLAAYRPDGTWYLPGFEVGRLVDAVDRIEIVTVVRHEPRPVLAGEVVAPEVSIAFGGEKMRPAGHLIAAARLVDVIDPHRLKRCGDCGEVAPCRAERADQEAAQLAHELRDMCHHCGERIGGAWSISFAGKRFHSAKKYRSGGVRCQDAAQAALDEYQARLDQGTGHHSVWRTGER